MVDKEGFSIIPEDHNHKDGKYCSSSDSETGKHFFIVLMIIIFFYFSDDDQPHKIKVEIKPLSQDMLHKSSASIDELRDAIGNMSVSNSANVSYFLYLVNVI